MKKDGGGVALCGKLRKVHKALADCKQKNKLLFERTQR